MGYRRDLAQICAIGLQIVHCICLAAMRSDRSIADGERGVCLKQIEI